MKEFGKYISESYIDTNIPNTVKIDGTLYGNVRSSEDLLLRLGYLPVDREPSPVEKEGYYYEEKFALLDSSIRSYWEGHELPPRNLSLSKRKLMNELKAVGKWNVVKQWMQDNDAWDDWLMATTLDEQDPLMQGAINALPSLGFSDQDIEKILVNSEVM